MRVVDWQKKIYKNIKTEYIAENTSHLWLDEGKEKANNTWGKLTKRFAGTLLLS